MREGRVHDCLRAQRFARKIYEEGENEHEGRHKGLALRADEKGFVLARRKEDEIHQAKDDGAAGRRSVRGAKQLVEPGRTETDETERQHHRVPDIPTGDNRQRQPGQARKEEPMLVMLAAKLREGQRAAIVRTRAVPRACPTRPKTAPAPSASTSYRTRRGPGETRARKRVFSSDALWFTGRIIETSLGQSNRKASLSL